MARLLFIVTYGESYLGARQLVANLRQAGHEACLLCFKQYGSLVLEADEEASPEWQICLLPDGRRMIPAYTGPATEQERKLAAGLLKQLRPDAVGLSVFAPHATHAAEVTMLVRQTLPGVPVIWGGPHATLDADRCAQIADYVVVGEADELIVEIADAIDSHRDLSSLPSMAYRTNGTLARNQLKPLLQDLDSLPYAYFGQEGVFYLDRNVLREGVPVDGTNLLDHTQYHIVTSRGCPFQCSYCMPSYTRKLIPESARLRYRSPRHVVEEIEQEVRRGRGHFWVNIWDDVFTLDVRRVREFFDLYTPRIGLPVWCYTHPRFVTDEMVEVLKSNNTKLVILGIQTGSDRVARDIFNRPVTGAQVLESARLLDKHKIGLKYDLISNNPFETDEDRLQTVRLLRELPRPYRLEVGQLAFYPNTRIDAMRREHGLPQMTDWRDSRFWNAMYHLCASVDMTEEDLDWFLAQGNLRSDPSILEKFAHYGSHLGTAVRSFEVDRQGYERKLADQARTIQRLRKEVDFARRTTISRLSGWFSRALRRLGKLFL